jgi:hypothetical protein
MKLIRNKAQCLICNNIIESTYRHDFRTCTCGALSVDGGLAYERRCGSALSTNQWVDLCEYSEEEDEIDKKASP